MIEKLNINEINRSHIDITHRLSSNSNSPIIVKFTTRTSRNLFYEARKGLKNLTIANFGFNPLKGSKNKIFINESLTPDKKSLFKKVRERCAEFEYKFTWTRNGTIYVKKNEKSPPLKMIVESDLQQIQAATPQYPPTMQDETKTNKHHKKFSKSSLSILCLLVVLIFTLFLNIIFFLSTIYFPKVWHSFICYFKIILYILISCKSWPKLIAPQKLK